MENHNKLFIRLKKTSFSTLSLLMAPISFNQSWLKVCFMFDSLLLFISHMHVYIFQNRINICWSVVFSVLGFPFLISASYHWKKNLPLSNLSSGYFSYWVSDSHFLLHFLLWGISLHCFLAVFRSSPQTSSLYLPKYKHITTNLFNKYLNCTYSFKNCSKYFINKY